MDSGDGGVIKLLDRSLVLPYSRQKLTIGTKCLRDIMAGRKKYEVRLGYLGIVEYQAGDEIELVASQGSCQVSIMSVQVFSNMRELVKGLPCQEIVPHAESMEEAYDALVHQHLPFDGIDIYVFELEPIKVQIIG